MYSGLSVEEVSSSDVMTDSVMRELVTFWPMEREMLAMLIEMVHALILTTQKAAGAKGVGKPIKIQRPPQRRPRPVRQGEAPVAPRQVAPAPNVIRMSEFVRREQEGTL